MPLRIERYEILAGKKKGEIFRVLPAKPAKGRRWQGEARREVGFLRGEREIRGSFDY